MSPLKCIRYVHLDTVDLLETLPPRQRRKYRRHWRERNWAARNDDSSTTVGRGSFSCSNIIPSNPNIPNISGLRQTTQKGCCAVFSPPTCTKSGGKKGGKNCQLPNLDFPPASIGGTPATSWPQLQPHHLPHQHTTCHSFSCRRVLPPPFPQAPFFRVSRHGSCHDFHSCSSFLEQLQHLDRRPEQIRQDLPQRPDDSEQRNARTKMPFGKLQSQLPFSRLRGLRHSTASRQRQLSIANRVAQHRRTAPRAQHYPFHVWTNGTLIVSISS